MSWLLVNADNSLVSVTTSDAEPMAGAGQRVVEVALGYPDTVEWSQARGKFVDLAVAAPLMSAGRFVSRFTLAEQIGIHTASDSSPTVRALLYMLQGFTEGVSLSDPMLQQFVGLLASDGLLTADRAAQVLAGTSPQ